MEAIALNPGQAAFWRADARLRALLGGRGSGKTAAGALEALRMAQERPGKPGLICAPTYGHLTRSTLPEWERWAEHAIRDMNKSERWYRLRTGSKVWYASLDDPDSIRGMSVNWLWGDELAMLPESAWLILLATLRVNPDPRGWLTSTPRGFNWVYDHFIKRAEPGMTWVGHASVYENSEHLDPDYIKSLELSYSGAFKEQELLGQFADLGSTLFDRGWFDVVEQAPEDCQWARFWDLACSVREAGDYTVGAKVGLSDGHLYVADILRGKWAFPDAKRVIIEQAHFDGNQVDIGIEQAGMQLMAVQELQREPDLLGFYVRGVVPDHDKLARALPWASRAEQGLVHLIAAPWNQDFLDEVMSFPGNTVHDDQVDAVSGAVAMLAKPTLTIARFGRSEEEEPKPVEQERYGEWESKRQKRIPWTVRGRL